MQERPLHLTDNDTGKGVYSVLTFYTGDEQCTYRGGIHDQQGENDEQGKPASI